MFVRIENKIININEIRSVELKSIGYDKGIIVIHFRACDDELTFTTRPFAECQAIIDTLAEACIGKNN